MTRAEAIETLMMTREELTKGEKFKGKAAILKEIAKDIAMLTNYPRDDNVPGLFVKEINRKLSNPAPDQIQVKLPGF